MDGAKLGNSFCEMRFFIPFHILSSSHLACFENNLLNMIFYFFFIRVDNRFLYCSYLIWALVFKVTSFTYLVSKWFLMETHFCRPRVIHDLFLNFIFCLEIFFRGTCKSKIGLNLVRKSTNDWSTSPLFHLIKFSQFTDR